MTRHVIEYGGMPMGVAVHDNGDLRFMAVKFQVFDLDGQRFQSVGDIRRAIGKHIATAPRKAA